MPLYNTLPIPPSIGPGDPEVLIVNAEQLGAGNYSQQVALAEPYGERLSISVRFTYASAPASVEYDIYVANNDVPAQYIKIGSTTNVNGDRVDISMENYRFRFLRVLEKTAPGVNATVGVLA